MGAPRQLRMSGGAGICAGVLYGAQGVILLFEPRTGVWLRVVYALFAAAVVLTAVALRGLHACERRRDGRLGLTGFYLSSIGLGFLAVSALVRAVFGRELLDVVFALGFLLAIIGYLLLAVAFHRAAVLPRWSAPLPLLGAVGAVVLQDKHGAGVVMGVVWVLLGLVVTSPVFGGSADSAPESSSDSTVLR
jgi:hypothetical protein